VIRAPLHRIAEVASIVSNDSPSLEGVKVASIRLTERLGEGGMGQVYLGVDERLERSVAVKAIHPGKRLDARARALFLREAKVLSQLEHPNICRLYDLVEQDGEEYLILELVPGKTLRLLEKESGLGLQDKRRIADQVAAALVAAHALSIIHRDLKPENIMVSDDGVVKVLDFGIARREMSEVGEQPFERAEENQPAQGDLTIRGQVKGTPFYMSPEQAQGNRVTAASDMYSFGLVLFELFTETHPYGDASDYAAVLNRATWGDIEPVQGLEPPLAKLIEELTAYKPQDRPGAEIVAKRLEWIWGRRRRLVRRLLVAAAGAGLALAATVSSIGFVRAKRAQALAERREQETAAVSDFLVSLFDEARPTTAEAGTLTARDIILDAGAKRLRYELQDQPETRARLLSVIGGIYGQLGSYREGEELLLEALELRRKLHGDTHILVAETMAALSNLYRVERRFHRAVEWYRQALEVAEQSPGHDPAAIARFRLGLAQLLKEDGATDEAEHLLRQAQPALLDAFGEDDVSVLAGQVLLASLLRSRGELDEAQALYEDLLPRQRRLLGEGHVTVAVTLNNLAYLLRTRGDYAQAEQYYREALQLTEKIYGPNHSHTLVVLQNLMGAVMLQHRLGEVEQLAREMVDRCEDREGERAWRRGDALIMSLGLILLKQKKYHQAEQVIREGVPLYEHSIGERAPRVAKALGMLAAALLGQGKELEATAELRRSLAIYGERERLTHEQWDGVLQLIEYFEALSADDAVQAYRALLTDDRRWSEPQ